MIGPQTDLRAQVAVPATPPFDISLANQPRVYASLAWNERKAGEPYFLQAQNSQLTVAAGAIANTRFIATQEYWYEIVYFVYTVIASGVGSTLPPLSVRTRSTNGNLTPFPNFVPIQGAMSDGRRKEARLPVPYVLRPNTELILFVRNDTAADTIVSLSARCNRVLSQAGDRL